MLLFSSGITTLAILLTLMAYTCAQYGERLTGQPAKTSIGPKPLDPVYGPP